MDDDREIARRSIDLQTRGRDYRLLDIPAYVKWSEQKLLDGESEALLAHLDSMSMFLLPEELSTISDQTFEEMLDELR